ncbi:hypothetical protein AVEN_1823-1, partial [Araneus ventricosus]
MDPSAMQYGSLSNAIWIPQQCNMDDVVSKFWLCLLIIDTDICKIPGYPLLKCQKVVADRFSKEVD